MLIGHKQIFNWLFIIYIKAIYTAEDLQLSAKKPYLNRRSREKDGSHKGGNNTCIIKI